MTLTTRIVAALVLAALIPMAVVLAVPLTQAGKRADEATARSLELAHKNASFLIEKEREQTRAAADGAATALAKSHSWLAAVVSGPEAAGLAERFRLDRLEIRGGSGVLLAAFEGAGITADAVTLTEQRNVPTENEMVTLIASRVLGESFITDVWRSPQEKLFFAHVERLRARRPSRTFPSTRAPRSASRSRPQMPRGSGRSLLRSFAGLAPVAFLAALAVGLVLAARISRPVRDLAERAESISAQRSGPITLLPDKDETRRMTVAFDQMLDALEASERQRLAAERVAAWEEIAKRLAHEIKNPLSPIQLAVENLERTRKLAPQAFDQAFDVETRTIKEEVRSLRILVDEFAQFARLPRPHLAPCDPRAVLDQALTLYAGRIAEMNVALSVEAGSAPATIRADAEQLGRVLKNVIANALDAMEESSDRQLSVAVSGRGDRVSFVVRDTGSGFDAETLRRVFEPYFTTRAGRGGTGLGMAIARRIAVEHGGTLHAEGAPGRGATITLTIPVA